jgi:hypothetical protein
VKGVVNAVMLPFNCNLGLLSNKLKIYLPVGEQDSIL